MIRQANPIDAPELTGLAHRSKQYWGYSDEQVATWSVGLTVTPEFIEDNMVYVSEVQDNIISFYALVIIGEKEFELEHFWVEPKSIGIGKGRSLFSDVTDKMISTGRRGLRIVSDPNARAFYERMGAVYEGEYFSPESGRYLPLLKFSIE